MSGFLNHLANLALGVKPPEAARLALPPRFAPRAPVLEPVPGASGFVANAERPAAPVHPTAPADGPADGPASSPQAAARDDASAILPALWETSETVRAPPSPTRAVPPPAIGPPAPRQDTALPLTPTPVRRPDPVAQPSPVAAAPPAAPLPGPLTAVRGQGREAPSPIPARRAAPLGEEALRHRALPRPEPPVIHVTIERIDLRAAPPSRPAAAPRAPARPQPDVSLADYLRGGARGGRP